MSGKFNRFRVVVSRPKEKIDATEPAPPGYKKVASGNGIMPGHESPRAADMTAKLLILIGATSLLMGCNTTLDRSTIKIAASELRSQAAQIKLIAGSFQSDGTTSAYRSAQLSFLEDKIRDSREKLSAGAPEPGLEQHLSRAQLLGAQVSDQLKILVSGGENGNSARQVETNLGKVIDEFARLEASLEN